MKKVMMFSSFSRLPFQLTASAASSSHHGLSAHAAGGIASTSSSSITSSSHHQHRQQQQQNSLTDLTADTRGRSGNAVPSPDLLLSHVASRAAAAAAELELRAMSNNNNNNGNGVDQDSEESTGDQDSCYHEATLKLLSKQQQHLRQEEGGDGSSSRQRRNSLELLRQQQQQQKEHRLSYTSAAAALTPPTPFADHFLEDAQNSRRQESSRPGQGAEAGAGALGRQCKTMPRKIRGAVSSSKTILPPPPQYKGVHFAPEVKEKEAAAGAEPPAIPLEGLPTGPARPNRSSSSNSNSCGDNADGVVIPSAGETVPITVRKLSGPPVPIKPKMQPSSSMTFTSSTTPAPPAPPPVPPHQALPPQPPLQPPTQQKEFTAPPETSGPLLR